MPKSSQTHLELKSNMIHGYIIKATHEKYVTIVYILRSVTYPVILHFRPAIFSLSTTDDQTNGQNFEHIGTLIAACNIIGS